MGTRNTLVDLNDYLFLQIERLNDEELTGEALETELKKSRALSQLAGNVIGAAGLVLEATKFNNDYETAGKAPRLLIGNSSRDENAV